LRRLALLLRDRLWARGLDLGVARIQVALGGRAKSVRAALVAEMENVLGEMLPEGQDLSLAVAQAISDSTRLDDLRWVDAQRIAMLARQWLAAQPGSSMRQLAIRVAETVREFGYSTSSNTIQPILGGHKKKARGYVYRAMRQQFPEWRESLARQPAWSHHWRAPAVPEIVPRGVDPSLQPARSTAAGRGRP
jgi:hypothetical protein